jgi:hypothetical protein
MKRTGGIHQPGCMICLLLDGTIVLCGRVHKLCARKFKAGVGCRPCNCLSLCCVCQARAQCFLHQHLAEVQAGLWRTLHHSVYARGCCCCCCCSCHTCMLGVRGHAVLQDALGRSVGVLTLAGLTAVHMCTSCERLQSDFVLACCISHRCYSRL